MKREEYLTRFQEQVQLEIENSRQAFSAGLIAQADQLRACVLDNFRQIKALAAAAEKEYMMFFYFSLLKTDVLNRKYTIVSQAMDNRWYLDEEMIETRFSLDFLFSPINQLWDFLLKESQGTLGRVNCYDVRQIIFAELKLHNNGIAHLLRYLLKDLAAEPAFKDIPKVPCWILRWGEYRDTTQIILQLDQSEKTQKQWHEAVRNAMKQKDDFVNSYWYKTELKEYQCENLDMRFMTFEACQIENTTFRNIDFSETRFINTHLTQCHFPECDLQGVDFRQATFENVDFQGANLKNAIFSFASLAALSMSPEQMQGILVDKEEQDAVFQNETR